MQSQHKWQRHSHSHSHHRLRGCPGQIHVCSAPGQVWKCFSVPEEIRVPEIFKITSFSLLKDFQALCQGFLKLLLKLNSLLAFVLLFLWILLNGSITCLLPIRIWRNLNILDNKHCTFAHHREGMSKTRGRHQEQQGCLCFSALFFSLFLSISV